MSSHIRLASIAAARRASFTRWRCFLLIATTLTIQGCATPPRPLVGPDPADPDVRVPAVVYRSTVGDFNSAQLSEPAPWRNGGDSTPQPKKDGR